MASEIPDDTTAPATTTTAPAPEEASLARFPRDPAEFDSDPRISFSKLDNKFILETEDGQEYEYDTALKRWILAVCFCRFRSFLRSSLEVEKKTGY